MGMMARASNMSVNLPAEKTRSQFVVLRGYRLGLKSPIEIANSISMDKTEVDAETSALVANGYLTKDLKLSTKAMNLLAD